MKKRLLCLVLAFVMMFSLIACGGEGTTSGNETVSNGQEIVSDDQGNQLSAPEAAIQARKDSGEYPTIVMAFASFTGPSDGAARVNAAIKKYTEEIYGISLEINNYDLGSWVQQMQLAFTSGEQIDLYSSVILGYSNMVNLGATINLEENGLLETYGQGIIDTIGWDYIETCRLNGEVHGVPNLKEFANGTGGVFISKQFLDGIGYDYEAVIAEQAGKVGFVLDNTIKADYDMVTEIFAQLKAAYPDKTVLSANGYDYHVISVDPAGGDSFGVLFADSTDLVLENLYESEEWLEYVQHVYKWNQAGYISPDALTDSEDATVKIQAGEIMAWISNTKPDQTEAYEDLPAGSAICFMLGDYFSKSTGVNDMPWCIGSGCEDPVAAMQILNALYTDPVLLNLLALGEEGIDYVRNEDGTVGLPEGVTADQIEYSLGVVWEMPNQFLAYSAGDAWEKYNAMNTSAVKSPAAGFIFDNSSVQNEQVALNNVIAEYYKQIMYGFVDPAEAVPEMIAKLKAAGYDTYVAEKQRQLNEWAAAN